MSRIVLNVEAVIEAAATEQTGYIDTQAYLVAGFVFPTGYSGTGVTFQGSLANQAGVSTGDFFGVTDAAGVDITVVAAADKFVAIDPQTLAGVRFVKIVSDTAQVADCVVGVVLVREA